MGVSGGCQLVCGASHRARSARQRPRPRPTHLRTARREERRLFTEPFGRLSLELHHSRVIAEHVIPDRRVEHRLAHGARRLGDRIAAHVCDGLRNRRVAGGVRHHRRHGDSAAALSIRAADPAAARAPLVLSGPPHTHALRPCLSTLVCGLSRVCTRHTDTLAKP